MRSASRTDLAAEAIFHADARGHARDGYSLREETREGLPVLAAEILTPAAADRLGKPVGRYYTLTLPEEPRRSSDCFRAAAAALAALLGRLLPEPHETVLVAALGNPDITPDALGPLTAQSVLATRHLRGQEAFSVLRPVSVLRAGVLGCTGVEAAQQVRALCRELSPDAVIAVDALAGADPRSLCRCVQLCDSGISPGSGVCNNRQPLDRTLLGVPVLGVGVPTVADAAAFSESEESTGLFVTPRSIDREVRSCARLLGYSIDLALQPALSPEDVEYFLE